MNHTSTARPRLNIGCGKVILPGWVNIDLEALPGVDMALDVTKGLPFENVEFIVAEHFLEHLEVEGAIAFLAESRRVLADDGVLRLSTPNLDWVWTNMYVPARQHTVDEAVRDCYWINKSFHGWGHHFLWNHRTLVATLEAVGFDQVETVELGKSRHAALCGVEHHDTYIDTPEVPHVLVVEASGRRRPDPSAFAAQRRDFDEAVHYEKYVPGYGGAD